MDYSIHNQLVTKIKSGKRGNLIFPSSFLQIGSSEAVRQALSRLRKEGMLIRIAHGVYLYPRMDEELGVLYPSADEIAERIARREGIKLLANGAYALNRLGLSTQVPMKATYLTNGKPRTLKVGKTTIIFKRVEPKKLAAKGKLSGLVIQALAELGKENVTDQAMNRIDEVLQNEDPKKILHDAKLAPAWIARILYDITKKIEAK